MHIHRILLTVVLSSLLLVPVRAQEKYSVVLEQARTLSPYEAIYLLMDYQYWRPEHANTYYQLGNLCYGLLPTRDPLHHYPELSTLLYQSRLFYGNCLHFAKDQKLVGWQYEEIANGEKKIEYERLERYISPRLAEIKRQQIACDSIHNSFCRMVERYNRCQTLFSAFLSLYTREKTAHIYLQPEQRQMLIQLQMTADSLDYDIGAFLQALTLQPVPGYYPYFHKEPILLYRLDGLTHTDFLVNDIPVWDYSGWVRHFMYDQTMVYERLYANLQSEFEQLFLQLRSYQAGGQISGNRDASLISQADRLGLHSPYTETIHAMQQAVQCAAAEQAIGRHTQPGGIRELVPYLQIALETRAVETPPAPANEWNAIADSAKRLIDAHLIQMAQALSVQHQPTYRHPVTEQTIRYDTFEGEKVLCLLPDNDGYRCVLETVHAETQVLCLQRDLETQRIALRLSNETPLVFARISGKKWALVTAKNVHFIE